MSSSLLVDGPCITETALPTMDVECQSRWDHGIKDMVRNLTERYCMPVSDTMMKPKPSVLKREYGIAQWLVHYRIVG